MPHLSAFILLISLTLRHFLTCLPPDCQHSFSPLALLLLRVFLQATSQWLDSYFAGENPSASLVAVGSPASTVAQAVFSHLAATPLGQTTTYQALAHEVEVSTGKPTSARGVASVLAHNPVLLLRPCHRVVASSGALSGYAGGVERKRELLTLERTWAGLA